MRLVLIVPLLAACTSAPPSPPRQTALLEGIAVPELQAAVCPATRQVAEKHADQDGCPTAGPGWSVRPLFPPTDGALDSFCLYEAKSDGPPNIGALPPGSSPDCNVVGAEAAPSPAAELALLEAGYLGGVEALASLPRTAAGLDPARVRVAVIDTARDRRDDGLAGAGDSPHGRAVANVVARLACPDRSAGCLVDVVNALGLQLVKTATGFARPPTGGHFGSIADVAEVIARQALASPLTERQVLNLSLGWHTVFGGAGDPALMPAPMRALFSAVQLARCRGNLILAAAGNTGGERPPGSGPLAPGLWEQQPAPSGQRCGQLGVAAPRTEPGQPLLFAIAGVTNGDAPLYNTRMGARPRLVAPGEQVYLADDAGPVQGRVRAPYTGSSMAVAGASGAAAAVWAHLPGLGASEVIEHLADSGVALGFVADFCLGSGPCEKVTRLSLCRAVAAACSASVEGCDVTPICPSDGARPGAKVPDPRLGWPADPCSVVRTGPGCQVTAVHNTMRVPGIGPQPGDPICVTCKQSFSGQLSVTTNPAHVGDLYHATGLFLVDDFGPLWINLAGRFPALTGGATYSAPVDLAAEGVVGAVTYSQIDFVYSSAFASNVAVTEPLTLGF